MKFWHAALAFFLLVGLGVAVISGYKASVVGLMNNMGLVDSDFSTAVIQEKIDKAVMDTRGKLACDLPARLRGTFTYLLAGDNEQGKLAFKLGEDRIKCGAQILSDGDTEVGTYEIIKGIKYLSQGYSFVAERVVADRRVCIGIPEGNVDTVIDDVLDATSGRVYQIIWSEWGEVLTLREPVEEACLDQRMKTR